LKSERKKTHDLTFYCIHSIRSILRVLWIITWIMFYKF
jgi:hypothetical protein